MNTRAVVLTLSIFALIVAGMFGYAYLKNREMVVEQQPDAEPNEQQDVQDGPYTNITRVEGTHFYLDGVHTVVGEIPMPTPCDLLETDANVAESFPEQISIDFTASNSAEFCAQTITPARYKVSATASEEATFSARLNGRAVELNLAPAAPGESPDDFEVFIKG